MLFWKRWSDAYANFGLHDEALRRIERARALAPENPTVLTSYATILDDLGRMEEALAVERQALAQIPAGDQRERAMHWSNIGTYLARLERYAEAEAAFAEALRLTPADADAWHNRATNAGAWALAEQAAERVETARVQVTAGLEHIAEALRLNSEHPTYRQVERALLKLRNQL